jgi:hypothetical protein
MTTATAELTQSDIERALAHGVPVVSGSGYGVCAVAGMFLAATSDSPYVALSTRSQTPSDRELELIRAWCEFGLRRSFKPFYADQVLAAPLPLVTGINSVILLKRSDDDWGYRRTSFTVGPQFFPAPPGYGEAVDLCGLFDVIENRMAEPDPEWEAFKAERPQLFG